MRSRRTENSGIAYTLIIGTAANRFFVRIESRIESAVYSRSGLVAREDPGSRRAADKSLCFHENHCDTQLWARAAH